MQPLHVVFLILAYFGVLILIAYFQREEENANTFFQGNRDTPWYIIAFGMIGTSISGITFISVPGAVGTGKFGYMMVVLGYLLGYWVVAKVLMPIYYKQNLVSIYQYLENRFGMTSYKTGAAFFLLSRLIGASLRLGVVAIVLQQLVFEPLGIPFAVAVAVSVLLIYVYTFQSGVKTVIWTDTIQTFGLLAGLILSIVIICRQMNWGLLDASTAVLQSDYAQLLFTEVNKPNFFLKSFIGGAAITIAMTGLDQDMMQKNLACRSLADAQKNMFWFSATLLVVNLLFVGMGAMMYLYATDMGYLQTQTENGKTLYLFKQLNGEFKQIRTDQLFPLLANTYLGTAAAFTFILGVVAAAYSSADSAMTALTSSFCIDILGFQRRELPEAQKKKTRYLVHISIAFLTFLLILYFYWLNDLALIDKVLGIAGYTYGPLIGLFAFGILTRHQLKEKWVPLACIVAAALSYLLQKPETLPAWQQVYEQLFGGYKFGIEVLLFNGLFTYLGLWLIRRKQSL